MKKINIGLIGFGNVGSGVVKILRERKNLLAPKPQKYSQPHQKGRYDRHIIARNGDRVRRSGSGKSVGNIFCHPLASSQ